MLVVLVLVIVAAILSGCVDSPRQELVEQKAPSLSYSIERENIIKRIQMSNDKNVIQWIYGISDTGSVIFFSPVVGKVTSGNKRLEPQIMDNGQCSFADTVNNGRLCTNEIMQNDGTYGSSDSYVFWFDPEGNIYQWSGYYIVSTVPLKLKAPVLNIREVDFEEKVKSQLATDALRQGKTVNNNLSIK